MKRIFIFLFLSVAAMADDSRYATAALNNGRAWAITDLSDHLHYVAGLVDMLSVYQVADPKDAAAYSFHATVGEIVKLLDRFYDDPANADVPVVLALTYAKHKVEGATPAQLEEGAANLRALANELNKAAPKSSQ
jgi:hypothetical protein